ncbi:MAG: hypothetical protein FJ304_17310 [Planctomycetes bacterium]|nr:hypothetical protein [Planctomycetota bacterium]
MRRTLLVCVTVLVGCGCTCTGCLGCKDVGEYRRNEHKARQEKVKPVIDALEKYKVAHGKYPQKLDELVSAGLIDAIPDLADNTDHQGRPGRIKDAQRLGYLTDSEGGEYYLGFRFVFAEREILLPSEFAWQYNSKRKSWEPGGRSLPPLVPPTRRGDTGPLPTKQ